MAFAEYPKMLVRGADEMIVDDAEAEAAAIADGFEFKGSDAKPSAEPAKPVVERHVQVEIPVVLSTVSPAHRDPCTA